MQNNWEEFTFPGQIYHILSVLWLDRQGYKGLTLGHSQEWLAVFQTAGFWLNRLSRPRTRRSAKAAAIVFQNLGVVMNYNENSLSVRVGGLQKNVTRCDVVPYRPVNVHKQKLQEKLGLENFTV